MISAIKYPCNFGLVFCFIAGLSGCGGELNLSDLKKQVETLEANQKSFKKREQQYLNRIESLESQVDEHDFLVGELIKTEEEASVDTRNLLDKLERTSARLREQIEQSRASAQRRDQDLSIRAKALESRIDNLLQQQRKIPSKPVVLSEPRDQQDSPQDDSSKNHVNGQGKAGSNNQASVFRAAYKVYLNGQYERATVEFSRFLKQYPTAVLTPQAYYYLGDSHYIRKEYDAATKALRHILTNYPESKYVSTALLKLGLVMKETGDKSQAKELWNRIIGEHPDSPEASLAKEQLEKL
ncbi:MAG: tol-pal system protein YbgF [Nitrospirales bacterium]|nr:tol-pal system protein YbgF [Nitrospira sp.]MDR4501190.1 tol-pal system protein YbgF [Nitrospirales bacterium]